MEGNKVSLVCRTAFLNKTLTANKLLKGLIFMVAPCINNIKHFIVKLMHTNYKILRLLK